MSLPLKIYTVFWIIYLVTALAYLFRTKKYQILFRLEYIRFLSQRWKWVTFIISGSTITLLGPYTIDYTWDYIDGFFMSVLTFYTAPWAVGTIYQVGKGMTMKTNIFPATALWFFSSSWSYDIYLYLRDGEYPLTWSNNFVLSSVLYISAGLFWNLDWKSSGGVYFAFTDRSWPQIPLDNHTFLKIFWIALPFAIIAMWLTLGLLK